MILSAVLTQPSIGQRRFVDDAKRGVELPARETQNVGNGDFSGFELSVDVPMGRRVRAGGNYTFMHREITDALQPNLRPTGVPTNRAFLWASWQPTRTLRVTPSLELADDRWSDINPVPTGAFPYVNTGDYHLLDLDATYSVARQLDLSIGFRNLFDDNYELAWGYPQAGRSFYVKTRLRY